MELKLLKCDWGLESLGDQAARLEKFAAASYDGVECARIQMDPGEFGDPCERLGLDYVAMMFCDDERSFRKQLDRIKRTRPLLINCHPGRDYFDFERGLDPEFGPPAYQPFDPHTLQPLADIWEVCLWITQRFRQRWAGRLA